MLQHKVKPGITGWAQVNGLRGETETLEKMQKRVEYAALQRLSLGFQKIDMHKSSIFQRHMLVKYFPNSRKNIFYVM